MDKKYLIDTNIIIYFLDGKIPEKQKNKLTEIFKNSFNISTITRIEVLGWSKIAGEEKDRIADFIKYSKTFFINNEIQDKTIEIKQINKTATPDAIIASTALINNFILVTRNESDFKKVNGLTIFNPFKEVV